MEHIIFYMVCRTAQRPAQPLEYRESFVVGEETYYRDEIIPTKFSPQFYAIWGVHQTTEPFVAQVEELDDNGVWEEYSLPWREDEVSELFRRRGLENLNQEETETFSFGWKNSDPYRVAMNQVRKYKELSDYCQLASK